jgi:hypothetical protein
MAPTSSKNSISILSKMIPYSHNYFYFQKNSGAICRCFVLLNRPFYIQPRSFKNDGQNNRAIPKKRAQKKTNILFAF